MQNITFSLQFFAILKKLASISKPKATVFFSSDGRFHINIPTTSTFLHLSVGANDFAFDGGEIDVPSLIQFIKFSEMVGYPRSGCVGVDTEMLTTGRSYSMLKFMNGTERASTKIARCICADATMFGPNARKVPVDRGVDKMKLLATVAFPRTQVNTMTNDMKNVYGCEFVTSVVDTKGVKFYLKGKTGEQVTWAIDRNCLKLGEEDAIIDSYGDGNKPSFRKFAAVYFNIMRGLEADFEMEVRHIKGGNTNKMMLKSFASIQGADPSDPIRLYAGAIECDGAEINAEGLVL